MHRTTSLQRVGATLLAAALTVSADAGGCVGDLDGSGAVDSSDLLQLLGAWGNCPGCPEDVNDDGVVDSSDLLLVLGDWGDCPDVGEIISIELAGNPLGQYPFFEFVRAFNQSAGVRIAIDPGNVPAGDTDADVYITVNKTAAQWESDPSLTDVRGVPQAIDFGGGTIQANTFLLGGTEFFPGDAGTVIGVGNDLVCDFNGNGVLDGGDLIAGLGDDAGFYIVKDIATSGPLAVTEATYVVSGVTPGFSGQNLFYPTNIASMGALPLVTISHGNGHQYTWYDYLATHLASHGFIVMSHQNNTMPGIETASTTTYEHTDAFLGQLGSIAGGILVGHVDENRIAWIGHSRGGEGVARAYTRVRDGLVSTTNYTHENIAFVSSIAPNNNLGTGNTEPGEVPYHLIWGAADGDISGSGTSPGTWSFAIYERAFGFRQSTYVHGADHNDFNCCGFQDFTGPAGTEIGRPEAQQVAKSVYLALLDRYLRANVPAGEYLWRQWESFKPLGVSANTVVINDYREPTSAPQSVIDDFQTNASAGISSSGGSVTMTVTNYDEGQLRDDANGYGWSGSEPMNGMSRTNVGDQAAGAVFDWSFGTTRMLEFEVVPAERDFSDDRYLTFRACQGTQHPETTAELADLSFSVTLRDGAGTTSTIDFAAYGGGIEEVYQRSGGWQNEYEVVRIRLADFLHNGSGLDLGDVEAIRFDFGAAFGSSRGRIGFDDLAVTKDTFPPTPGGINMSAPNGTPDLIEPGVTTTVLVRIFATTETIVPGSEQLFFRAAGGSYASTPLVSIGAPFYEATLPAVGCSDTPEFYFSAEGTTTGTITLPADAPASVFSSSVGIEITTFEDDFESNTGWTVTNDGALTDGAWNRGVPVGGGDRGDPAVDSDGSGQCYLTDNVDGNSDVDGGTTTLTSPLMDATHPESHIGYDRWYHNTFGAAPASDIFEVEVSDDGGATWIDLETVGPRGDEVSGGWITASFRVADIPGISNTSQFRIRFHASDLGEGSVVEAGIDAVKIFRVECD